MKKIKIFPMILLICVLMSGIAPCAWALDSPKLNGKAEGRLVNQLVGEMLK